MQQKNDENLLLARSPFIWQWTIAHPIPMLWPIRDGIPLDKADKVPLRHQWLTIAYDVPPSHPDRSPRASVDNIQLCNNQCYRLECGAPFPIRSRPVHTVSIIGIFGLD